MAINSQFWINLRKKDIRRKFNNTRIPKKAFLILCEGEKTEPNYFRGFPVTNKRVIVLGTGYNTKSLIQAAIRQRREAKKCGTALEQVWCVFDKDSNSDQDFNDAIALAKKNNINVAYSNEAFELWYVLHFVYLQSGLHRADYINRLSGFLGHQYKKNDREMYSKLILNQSDALRNAQNLLAKYSQSNPAAENPSTTVFRLVEELNKYIT